MSACSRPINHPLQLSTLLILILSTLTTTSPIPNDTNSLSSRSQPGVYMCAAELWTQPCQTSYPPLAPAREDGVILAPDLPCAPLPYASSQILSFGPDHDVTCILFRDNSCDRSIGGTETYTWPGTDYLPGPSNVDLQTGQSGMGFRAYGCRGSVDLG